MAKTESTAVNQLISSVQNGKPAAKEPGDDLFAPQAKPARMTSTIPPMRGAGEVSPLPRNRAPSGTSQHQLPKTPPAVRVTTAPPTRATTIPPIARASTPPARPSAPPARRSAPPPPRPSAPIRTSPLPPPATRTTQPSPSPVAAPFEAKPRPITIDAPGDPIAADHWFEASRAVDKADLSWSGGTLAVERTRTSSVPIKKLIAPAIVLAIVGVAVGGYLALGGDTAKKHPVTPPIAVVTAPPPKPDVTPAPPAPSPEPANAATATAGGDQPQPPPKEQAAAPAPVPVPAPAAVPAPVPAAVPAPVPAAVPAPAPAAAPAPDVHDIQTTRGVVELVDVRIDSKPSGATVMLVDNGKTSFLGTTPVAASLDPSRAYDVVFTLANHPTQMVHVDPTKTHRIELVLGHNGAAGKVSSAR